MPVTTAPPGPKGNWLSGNLPEFRRDMLAFLSTCAREYGDFASIRLGHRRIFLLSHPDYIEFVLVSGSRNFSKHFAKRFNRPLLGNGLLSSDGDFWRRQRRLAQPAFYRDRIAAYGEVVVSRTHDLLATWEEGNKCDIHEEMMHLALGIVAQTLFGGEITVEADRIGAALDTALKSFMARLNSLFSLPSIFPTPKKMRLRRAIRELDEVVYRFIRQRRNNADNHKDLLSLLLAAQDENDGSRMSDKQVRDEAMTLFLAGYETTALALSWTWLLLAENPQAEARLAAETTEVLKGRVPTSADLPHLPYLESVLLESMRLYPPAYVIGRECIQECEVGGYRIPRGRTIWLSQWVLHRDPRYFNQPLIFQPERWLDGLADRIPRCAYFPFGGGPRLCIGNSFAMMEMSLALAMIAQKFHFTRVTGHEAIPIASFTLRPQNGIQAVLKRRQ